MKTSRAGLELIKLNEGCELIAYLDQLANPPVWTIGYGDTQNVQPGLRITQQEAEERVARRLAREFEPGVWSVVHDVPTTQAQFDAMVSLAWNIGVGRLDDPSTPEDEGRGFKGSTVVRMHRAGRYAEAAEAFKLWNKAGGIVRRGLVRRRAEEAALYLSELPVIASPPEELRLRLYEAVVLGRQLQERLAAIDLGDGPLYKGPIDGWIGEGSAKAGTAAYRAWRSAQR